MYVNYYQQSIKSAAELGYEVKLLCCSTFARFFDGNKHVKVIHKNDSTSSRLFDFNKCRVLNNFEEDFVLIDGDIILKERLNLGTADLIYETKCYTGESNLIKDQRKDKTWYKWYKPYVNKLTELGIDKIIPEWTGKRLDFVHNIGLLYFNNYFLKKLYIDRWTKFDEFVTNAKLDNSIKYTVVGAQYLLTEIINYHNFSYSEFNPSEFDHNIGVYKFTFPKVSKSEIRLEDKKSML